MVADLERNSAYANDLQEMNMKIKDRLRQMSSCKDEKASLIAIRLNSYKPLDQL